jgi:hypothetical protein
MNFSDERRLNALRAADKWRLWRSLDDERLCIQCAQLLSGHDVILGDNGDESLSVSCPTSGCDATPRDWFYHGARNAHELANIVSVD